MEQAKRMVAINKVPSLLMLLGLTLATLLAAAAPTFAQEEFEVEARTEVKPPVTGVLKDTGLGGRPVTDLCVSI